MGSPKETLTGNLLRLKLGFTPLVYTRWPPHTIVGITGTPAPIANRTAPDFKPLISKLVEIVPSGNMPIISPDLSARKAATNDADPLLRSTFM